MKEVLMVAGEICSGKDTYVENFINTSKINMYQIDLGELVREKFNTKERVFDNTLEDYFIERIEEIIYKLDDGMGIVITGLRQPTLAKKIAALFDTVHYIYLVAPRNILKQRYANRAAVKDAKITFEDAIKGDDSLGMKELQHYLLTEVECNFIKSY